MDNVRVLPRTTAFGYYAQNFVGLVERVTDHLAAPDPEMPRERLWQVRAKRVIIAAGAIERHMVFRQQRPAGHHAGLGGADLSQPSRRRGRQEGRRLHGQRQRLCGGDRPQEGGCRHPGDRRSARPIPTARWWKEAKALGIRVLTGHAVTGAGGKLRVASMTVEAQERRFGNYRRSSRSTR
jgi:sarcosine oxidase subunit alpha